MRAISQILSRAKRQINQMDDVDLSFDDARSKISITAKDRVHIDLVKKIIDTTLSKTSELDKKGDKCSLIIRWNTLKRNKDGLLTTGGVVNVDTYKSKVLLKDGEYHHSMEYGHRAFPMSFRYEAEG